MEKLRSEADAIKQAVEAGYKLTHLTNNSHFALAQDPAFWQALGKARAWKKVTCGGCGKELAEMNTGFPVKNCDCFEQYEEMFSWKYHASEWFETLLSGGDVKDFWESLP